MPDAAWLVVCEELAAELLPLSPGASGRSRRQLCAPFLGRCRTASAGAAAIGRGTSQDRGGRARRPRRGRSHARLLIEVACRLADRYSLYRDENLGLFPDAHEVVDALKARGVLLALVTNGAAEAQRAKIDRFDLARRFDHIQIEGEHGFGKPEERAYTHAMDSLGVEAHETWMVGDNLEWEVAAPQRLGIHAIWCDAIGKGLPPGSTVKPDRIMRTLSELLPRDARHGRVPRFAGASSEGLST